MVPIKIEKKESGEREKRVGRPMIFKTSMILIGLAVLFLLTAGILAKVKSSDSNTRQAVFSTTGQIYFGFVQNKNSDMVQINDVYYLNNISSLIQAKSEDKISLIKMGSEIYKPGNTITLNRDHIIFIQDIQNDSQINKAIAASQK